MNKMILFLKADQSSLFNAPSSVKGHVRSGHFIAPYIGVRRHALKKLDHALTDDLFVQGQGQPATHIKTEKVKKPTTPHAAEATGQGGGNGNGNGGNGGNGNGDQDALREARRQYAAVVARYTLPDGTKAPGWMKAPNGEPTKLNERQWVQARTPLFKAWFGDWEYAAHQRAIDALATVPVNFSLAATLSLADARHQTLAEAKRRFALDQHPKKVTAPNGDEIWIAMSGLKEAISKHAGIQKMRILPILDQLIENSQFILAAPDEKPNQRKSPNVLGYQYYVAKATLDDKAYYVKLVVREVEDGGVRRKFYDHELSEVSEAADKSGTAHLAAAGNPPATASLDHIVHHGWQKFNSDVSQVVDANGEPLVVYHGSARKGEKANLPRFNTPAYFSESAWEASAYTDSGKFGQMMTLFENLRNGTIRTKRDRAKAERTLGNQKMLDTYFGGGQTGGVFPAFLNIKNPANINWTYGNRFSMERLGTEESAKNRMKTLADQDFDGVETLSDEGMAAMNFEGKRYEIKQWVVFYPTQVKSALGNTGEFSPANPDILKALPPHARILFFKAA